MRYPTKTVFFVFFKFFNIINMFRLATHESSILRFNLLTKLLHFSAYRIIPYGRTCSLCHCMDGENVQDSMYYEWVYDLQHVPKGFAGQLLFCLATIKEANQIKKILNLKHRNLKAKGINFVRKGSP